MRAILLAFALICGCGLASRAAPIARAPSGRIYQGFYYGGVGTDTHDPTEHDVAPADLARYEETVCAKAAWVYFSDNWFESRVFPAEMCGWIKTAGKIPYIRLMLRSDVDQKHGEKTFPLAKIITGNFDDDLRTWARAAKNFGSPILIEWGTEPNGNWFSWNAKWNGGGEIGTAKYIDAYRHIVDLMRAEGATNLQWVWHVNWDDDPRKEWNHFENYFPGADYCDWLGVSIYGPTTPMMRDDSESFAFKMGKVYPRLTKLAPGKPLIVAEFGCDIHNRHCNAADWARGALQEIFSGHWPALIGFCWWNEGWQNDDIKRHDSDLIIWHDPGLLRVFRDELSKHRAQIEETPVLSDR